MSVIEAIKSKSWKYLRNHLIQLPNFIGEQIAALEEGLCLPPRSNAEVRTQPNLNSQPPGIESCKILPDQATLLMFRGPMNLREAFVCIHPWESQNFCLCSDYFWCPNGPGDKVEMLMFYVSLKERTQLAET